MVIIVKIGSFINHSEIKVYIGCLLQNVVVPAAAPEMQPASQRCTWLKAVPSTPSNLFQRPGGRIAAFVKMRRDQKVSAR